MSGLNVELRSTERKWGALYTSTIPSARPSQSLQPDSDPHALAPLFGGERHGGHEFRLNRDYPRPFRVGGI